eukprot:2181527-Prymnesium_polylepis.4
MTTPASHQHQSKRRRCRSAGVGWPELELTGPGGFPGEDRLRSLAGDTSTLDGLVLATMGCNAAWVLQALGLPSSTIPILIACHHPVHCWSGAASKRRAGPEERPVPGHAGASLIFPPFVDAPTKRREYEQLNNPNLAPRGLLGCVHAKLLLFFRADSLRVVVSTANLTRRQWVDTRNHLWSCEFPRRAYSPAAASLLGDGFGAELAAFLSSMLAKCEPLREEAALLTRLAHYDYSRAAEQN